MLDVIDYMIEISGSALSYEVCDRITHMEIEGESVKIVATLKDEESKKVTVDMKLYDLSPEKAAEIAKILIS